MTQPLSIGCVIVGQDDEVSMSVCLYSAVRRPKLGSAATQCSSSPWENGYSCSPQPLYQVRVLVMFPCIITTPTQGRSSIRGAIRTPSSALVGVTFLYLQPDKEFCSLAVWSLLTLVWICYGNIVMLKILQKNFILLYYYPFRQCLVNIVAL